MANLPAPIVTILALFAPLFSRPVFRNLLLLFQGHILAKGRRTITDLLRVIHRKNEKNYSKYHWVLNGAKWKPFEASKILFRVLIKLLPADEEIVINLDSTIERRKGPKIQGLGVQRDAVRSSKQKKVLTIGLNWLVSAISIKFPFSNRRWSMPFFSILIPPKIPLSSSKNKKDLNKKTKHKKLTDWACQVAYTIRRWAVDNRKIVIVADSVFACFKMMYSCLRCRVGFISRMRLDARLYDFAPTESGKRKGRKRVAGKCLPKLSDLTKRKLDTWDEVEVQWYGGARKKIFIQSGRCLWYYIGFVPVPIFWVLIKETANADPVALFSTDLSYTAERVIELYIGRWSIEVTFEEARRHLGIETQRQWNDNAIERATPMLLASFSIITLMGLGLQKERGEKIPTQSTSWYKKSHVTFSDVLAYVREAILNGKYKSLVGKKREWRNISLEELILEAIAA